jgi:hypothetical protein
LATRSETAATTAGWGVADGHDPGGDQLIKAVRDRDGRLLSGQPADARLASWSATMARWTSLVPSQILSTRSSR